MNVIRNPILPGFNPDPCICRAGQDFYIATSTFEWFPGVQIHHSRDLVHWRLAGRALDRTSQLDMLGNPDSGGIWAPCLTHADGRFWLIYTDVKSLNGAYKDTPNYLVTADNPAGPWSEPIYLNASGFDPSLFHDEDGRKWLVNMVWDHRPGRNRFAGIVLQEYDHDRQRLLGEPEMIFDGAGLHACEGPHLYRRDGWYYLLTATGGTGYNHAVSLARSRSIQGPYELDPVPQMLTSRDVPECPLQKAGHASIVDTPGGDWVMVHLASRPITPHRRCPLGRETALQRVHWTGDGWLRLDDGGTAPQIQVPAPDLPAHPWPDEPTCHDFDEPSLPAEFQSLRVPIDDSWASLTHRPGFLRLTGRESLGSMHRQSLIARRLTHHQAQASTCVQFDPSSFQQMAGLVAYYNTGNWCYLHVTCDERLGRCLRLGVCDNGQYAEPLDSPLPVPEGPVRMRASFDREKLQFAWGAGREGDWTDVGPVLDASKLSDDYVAGWGFTGAFVGMACQDLSGRSLHADFDRFAYVVPEMK